MKKLQAHVVLEMLDRLGTDSTIGTDIQCCCLLDVNVKDITVVVFFSVAAETAAPAVVDADVDVYVDVTVACCLLSLYSISFGFFVDDL